MVVCECVWFQGKGDRASQVRLHPSELPTAPRPRVSDTEGREYTGSPSKAVSRAQPAGAAACITTTGFYLVQGGRDADGEVEREGKG